MKEKAVHQQELGLYIHIPFCEKKCSYCDFLSAAASDELKGEYIEALLKEINSYRGRTSGYCVPTIFFGGGTPSCIVAGEIARIMKAIRQVFNIYDKQLEATIEVNPGTITEDKLITYQNAGINRLSFGLQSADDKELKCLGRIHTFEDFLKNYQLARQLGFTNISIDLMSALPGQTLASWEKTLNTIAMLEPEHISAYSLIIEEGTQFYHRYQPGTREALELPDEETDRRIYYRTKELLEQYGYHRYEISNYAKQGYESRHNNSYWIGTDYLGLGLGAASLVEGVRFSNRSDLNEYIALCNTDMNINMLNSILEGINQSAKKDNTEELVRSILVDEIGLRAEQVVLTKQQRMEEFLFLGLRRCEGISRQEFKQRFSEDIASVYGKVIAVLEQKNLIETSGDRIRLTDYGIDISNVVLAEFLLN